MALQAVESVRFFENYQMWAMERVFAAARRAGSAADAGAIPGSNGGGTIHGLLGHIVDADIFWLNRWLDTERPMQMPGAWPTLPDVEAAWKADLPRRAAYFDEISEEELHREYGPPGDKMLIWKTVLHAHNHATHHRAEVSALLTTIGFPPAGIDMLDYIDGR